MQQQGFGAHWDLHGALQGPAALPRLWHPLISATTYTFLSSHSSYKTSRASRSTLKWQDYWPLRGSTVGPPPPHKTLLASTALILTSCPGSADILLLTLMDSIQSSSFDSSALAALEYTLQDKLNLWETPHPPSGPDSASAGTHSCSQGHGKSHEPNSAFPP